MKIKVESTVYKYRRDNNGVIGTVTVYCPNGGHWNGVGHARDDFGTPGDYIGHETCDYTTCGHNEGFVCARCKKRMCWCAGSSGCCGDVCDDCSAEIHDLGSKNCLIVVAPDHPRAQLTSLSNGRRDYLDSKSPGLKYSAEVGIQPCYLETETAIEATT